MKDKPITLNQLLAVKKEENLLYSDLLTTKEWRDFRRVILKRDNSQCKICKRKGNELAWWIGPGKIYIRQCDEIEKKYLNIDVEYSSKRVELHVHHTYYVKDHFPWQYSEDALITVCMECHENIHENEEIPVYINNDKESKILTYKCSKCRGRGYIKEYHYHMRGVCFSCDGLGYKLKN